MAGHTSRSSCPRNCWDALCRPMKGKLLVRAQEVHNSAYTGIRRGEIEIKVERLRPLSSVYPEEKKCETAGRTTLPSPEKESAQGRMWELTKQNLRLHSRNTEDDPALSTGNKPLTKLPLPSEQTTSFP